MNRTPAAAQLARIAALVSGALGLFAFFTWWLGEWRVVTFGPDYIPMAPITALLILALGGTLTLRLFWPGTRKFETAVLFAAGVTTGVAQLELLRTTLGFNLPWDQWFSSPALASPGGIVIGRMAPVTATTLALSALALAGATCWLARLGWVRWCTGLASGIALLIGTVVVMGYATGLPLGYERGNIPMALLTAIAVVALNAALLLTREFEEAPRTALGDAASLRSDPVFFRTLFGITAVIFTLLAAGGVYYLRIQQAEAREGTFQDLDAVVNLKSQQIEQWRQERMDDARFLQRSPRVSADVAVFLAAPGDPAAREAMLGWLQPMLGRGRYVSIRLHDATGRLLLVVPGPAGPDDSNPGNTFAGALSRANVVLGDLERPSPAAPIRMELVAPVTAPGPAGSAAPIAGIVLRIDPTVTLYPLLRDWPTPTVTGETLLVRRDGDAVLFLSDLSGQSGSALNVRRSLAEPDLPAAMAARGDLSRLVGRDYNAVPVLAAFRSIPASTWIVIAKIGQTEVYARRTNETWTGIFLVGLLLASVVLGASLILRQRRSALLALALESERKRTALNQRLAMITRHANDSIFTFDESMRIVDANDRAVATYGHTREQLLQLTARDIRAAATTASTAGDFNTVFHSDGVIFETVHRRRDGSTFPVEASSRAVELEGRRHVLSVIRDISERRAQAREVERLNRLYQVLNRINSALVHAETRAELFQLVCTVLVETGGFKLAWVGWVEPASRRVVPSAVAGDGQGYVTQLDLSVDPTLPGGRGPSGTALREKRTYVCNDFMADPATAPWHEAAARSGLAASIALPLSLDRQVVGALTVYAAERNFFQSRELELLEEAARDLSYGLEVFAERTHREEAEAALTANEARQQFLLSETPAVIYALRAGGDYATTYVSNNIKTVLGYEPGEFTADPGFWLAHVHPEDHGRATADFKRITAGTVLVREYRYRHRDGRIRWMRDETRVVCDATGRPQELIGCWLDITERKRDEIQLRKLSSIVEQAPLSIVITNTAGAIEYVNPTFTKVTGYTSAEALGQNPRILKSGETPAEVYREMWQALARGETWSGELQNRKKNGEIYIENAVIAPVVNGDGQITHYVALKEDVTTQLRTVALLAKEREVSEMKTRFISVTSHEFRTPMSAAMGSAELLAVHFDRLTPAKRTELLNRVAISLSRMNEMLDEILLLNRMDAKRVEVIPGPLDLRLLAQNSLEEARLADHEAHPFTLEITGETAGFVTDPSLMQHILSNLLSNAARYSPAGSPVTMRLTVEATGARLEVEDQGIGIPPADVGRLFQPFERGSNIGNIKGTGLGLSIVKRMIELLGGTVNVEPVPGGGSRFVIHHPRLPANPA